MSALTVANIIPIFAVVGGVETSYTVLTGLMGRGAVVSLTANSSNIVAAITAGLTAATTTHIEDLSGGSGHDDIAMPANFVLVTDVTGTTTNLTGPFQINATTGVVSVRNGAKLNFVAAGSQTIYVRTTDADGNSIITTHVIAVSDVSEPVSILRTLTKLADTFVALMTIIPSSGWAGMMSLLLQPEMT